MREIEKGMLCAIQRGKDFRRSNTRVVHYDNGAVVVWLYETPIWAKVFGEVYCCDGGWNTATTASRLNALGVPYHRNPGKCRIDLLSLSEMKELIETL